MYLITILSSGWSFYWQQSVSNLCLNFLCRNSLYFLLEKRADWIKDICVLGKCHYVMWFKNPSLFSIFHFLRVFEPNNLFPLGLSSEQTDRKAWELLPLAPGCLCRRAINLVLFSNCSQLPVSLLSLPPQPIFRHARELACSSQEASLCQ